MDDMEGISVNMNIEIKIIMDKTAFDDGIRRAESYHRAEYKLLNEEEKLRSVLHTIHATYDRGCKIIMTTEEVE